MERVHPLSLRGFFVEASDRRITAKAATDMARHGYAFQGLRVLREEGGAGARNSLEPGVWSLEVRQ